MPANELDAADDAIANVREPVKPFAKINAGRLKCFDHVWRDAALSGAIENRVTFQAGHAAIVVPDHSNFFNSERIDGDEDASHD